MHFFKALWVLAASMKVHCGCIPDSMASMISLCVSSSCRVGVKSSSKQPTSTNDIPDDPRVDFVVEASGSQCTKCVLTLCEEFSGLFEVLRRFYPNGEHSSQVQ